VPLGAKMADVRHRLFHTLVVVGAALPFVTGGCSSSEESTTPIDAAGTDSRVTGTGDSTTPTDATDAADAKPDASVDTADADETDDTCEIGGCGCLPCIK
jgi:hypothetical protein